MLIYGLTGGIACGKTTVTNILRENGINVIDCDVIAREVMEPHCWGYNRVCHAFGSKLAKHTDGSIDRAKLGQLVFGTRTERIKLESAVGLPIFFEILRQILTHWWSGDTILFIDAPTLYESKRLYIFIMNILPNFFLYEILYLTNFSCFFEIFFHKTYYHYVQKL
eukprot:GSMAST32.ASY1.ANO1.1174.1 assembled CDS